MAQTCKDAREPATHERPDTAPSAAIIAVQSVKARVFAIAATEPTILIPCRVIEAAADLIGSFGERERQAYRRGFEAGYRAGYDDADDAWFVSLAPAREAARRSAKHPTFAELEVRRWGPGGREHYADPKPGDYPGLRGDAR